MEHIEVIRLIPEVALTLVGFTGIVFALRVQASGGWTSKELFQLYAMTATPLTAFFCAFTPDLFATVISSEDLVWRLSNATLGALHLANVTPFLRRMSSIPTTRGQKILAIIGAALIASHFLAASAVIRWYEFVFLLGLLQQIYVGMHNFYLLLRPAADAS